MSKINLPSSSCVLFIKIGYKNVHKATIERAGLPPSEQNYSQRHKGITPTLSICMITTSTCC